VVLPWSTWAMIATLRSFMTKSQFARTSESGFRRKPAGCSRRALRIDQSLVAKVFSPEPTVSDVTRSKTF
jgi:hypothetical protein